MVSNKNNKYFVLFKIQDTNGKVNVINKKEKMNIQKKIK